MKRCGSNNPKVVIVVLVTATLISLGRSMPAPRFGCDQGIQTEAAYRLLKGLGLTSPFYAVAFPDLNRPPCPSSCSPVSVSRIRKANADPRT